MAREDFTGYGGQVYYAPPPKPEDVKKYGEKAGRGGYYTTNPETNATQWIADPAAAAGASPSSPTSPPAAQPHDLLTDLFNQYFGGGGSSGGGGTPSGSGGPGAGGNIWQKLMEAESAFVPEMLSGDYRSTKAGAAAYESAAAPINAKYEDMKRQVLERAAQQGMSPTSGIIQEQIANVDAARTQALSDLERQFNATLPQRQEAGLGQLSKILGLEEQRGLESLGIQRSLDEATRQRILDAATLGGNQGAAAAEGAASQASSLLGAASNLSNLYGQRASDQSYGLGSMLSSLGNYFQQRPGTGYTPDYSSPLYAPPAGGYAGPGGVPSSANPYGFGID